MYSSPLVLASNSPRRRELLLSLGVVFQICPQDIDESVLNVEKPYDYVQRVALEKALSALATNPGALVLAADTSVIVDDQILGKPQDIGDALSMLSLLSNREHSVLTAVTLANSEKQRSIVVRTTVNFRSISAAEAQRYWATGEPIGKAGGYAIQGFGAAFVESIEGSFSNVVGLPLFETAQYLQAFGVAIWQQEVVDS
ncbi:MAG TPA: septum formation inhibitor Maf [Gammaproteobacteria bacterium]|nr:septum formation inhibitor Maf [Gammaproteobacteria bacterium]